MPRVSNSISRIESVEELGCRAYSLHLACERRDALATHDAATLDKVSHAPLLLAKSSNPLAALYTRTCRSRSACPIACVVMIRCVASACASAIARGPIACRKPTMDRLESCIAATSPRLSIGFPYHVDNLRVAIERSPRLVPSSYVPHKYSACASAGLQHSARASRCHCGGTC
jgi:hypothetical protein